MSLTIATTANQASTLPPLLVAAFVNQKAGKVVVTIIYKDGDTLNPSDKTAVAAFVQGSDEPVYGSQNIVKRLTEGFPDTLRGKQNELVCHTCSAS